MWKGSLTRSTRRSPAPAQPVGHRRHGGHGRAAPRLRDDRLVRDVPGDAGSGGRRWPRWWYRPGPRRRSPRPAAPDPHDTDRARDPAGPEAPARVVRCTARRPAPRWRPPGAAGPAGSPPARTARRRRCTTSRAGQEREAETLAQRSAPAHRSKASPCCRHSDLAHPLLPEHRPPWPPAPPARRAPRTPGGSARPAGAPRPAARCGRRGRSSRRWSRPRRDGCTPAPKMRTISCALLNPPAERVLRLEADDEDQVPVVADAVCQVVEDPARLRHARRGDDDRRAGGSVRAPWTSATSRTYRTSGKSKSSAPARDQLLPLVEDLGVHPEHGGDVHRERAVHVDRDLGDLSRAVRAGGGCRPAPAPVRARRRESAPCRPGRRPAAPPRPAAPRPRPPTRGAGRRRWTR